MRRLCWAALALFVALLLPARALAAGDLNAALDQMDLSGWDAAAGDALGGPAGDLVGRIARNEWSLSAGDALRQLGRAALRAFAARRGALASLCALACVGAVLARFQQHLDGTVSALARAAVTVLCAGVPLSLLRQTLEALLAAQQRLDGFTAAALPALGALGAALGASGGTALLSPLAAGAASLASALCARMGRPALCLLAALALAEPFCPEMALGRLFDALRGLFAFALTAAVAVFACAALAQGTQAAWADSAALRGVRYAVDHYVPVVGGLFADTFDLLASGAWTLKNAVGLAAVVYLAALALGPLLDLAGVYLALRAGSLFAHLAGESGCGTLLERFSRLTGLAAALEATCAALYLVVLAAGCACTGVLP